MIHKIYLEQLFSLIQLDEEFMKRGAYFEAIKEGYALFVTHTIIFR